MNISKLSIIRSERSQIIHEYGSNRKKLKTVKISLTKFFKELQGLKTETWHHEQKGETGNANFGFSSQIKR